MRITLVAAALAVTLSACASSPRAAPGNNNSPPPQAPAPEDTAQTPGSGQAIASPRDVVEARIAGEAVVVDYGRPYMRGRQIFGGLVPFDQVWRTGANEATALRTSADIQVNGQRVPAGEYTLYSLLREGSNGAVGEWMLIINRQTGQWGTEYDQAQDLARIPMRVSTLDRPVEQFTIRVVQNGGAHNGKLVMMWERTQAELDFQVAS